MEGSEATENKQSRLSVILALHEAQHQGPPRYSTDTLMPPPSYHTADDSSIKGPSESPNATPRTSMIELDEDSKIAILSRSSTASSSNGVSQAYRKLTSGKAPSGRRLPGRGKPRLPPLPTDANEEEREFLMRNVAEKPLVFNRPPVSSTAPSLGTSSSTGSTNNNATEPPKQPLSDDLQNSGRSSSQAYDSTEPGTAPKGIRISVSAPSTNPALTTRGIDIHTNGMPNGQSPEIPYTPNATHYPLSTSSGGLGLHGLSDHDEIEPIITPIPKEKESESDDATMNMSKEQWRKGHTRQVDRMEPLANQHTATQRISNASATSGRVIDPSELYSKDTPEWYLKRFTEMTTTARDARSLIVSLQKNPISWILHFIEIEGIRVVAAGLTIIARKGSQKRAADIDLEYESLKCIRLLANQAAGANDIALPDTINAIAGSFNTTHIPSRRLVAEILTFLCYYNNGMAHESVLLAIAGLSTANGEIGRFDYWLQSLLATLNEDGGRDSIEERSLIEYAEGNLMLINGILSVEDFKLRVFYRARMESAGLHRVFELCHRFQQTSIEKHIKSFIEVATVDQDLLMENTGQDILKDLSDPYDVYRAILSSIEGTPACQHFLSALRYFLLVREEPKIQTLYYQLFDELVASIVLHKKPNFSGGLSGVIGDPISRLLEQLGEKERNRIAEEAASAYREEADQLRTQIKEMQEEMDAGRDVLIERLQKQLTRLGENLNRSQRANTALQDRLTELKKSYEEHVAQLELQILELFKMLRDISGSHNNTVDKSTRDRNQLISTLEAGLKTRTMVPGGGGSETEARLTGGLASHGQGERGKGKKDQVGDEGNATHGESFPIDRPAKPNSITNDLDATDIRLESSEFTDSVDADFELGSKENLANGPQPTTIESPIEQLHLMGSFGSRATIGGTTRTTRQSRGQKSISEGSEGTIDDSELGPSTSSTFTDDTPPSSIDVGDADSRVGTPEVYTPFGGIGATVSKFGIGSKSDRTSYGTGSNNGVHSQIIGHSPPLPLGIFRSALSSTAMLPIAGDVGPLSLTGAFPPHVGSSQPAARNGANIAPDSDKDPLNSAEGNVEQLQRAILTEQSNKRAQVTEEEDYPPNEQFAILDNSLNRLRATKSLKRRSSIRARGSTVIPMAIRTDVTGNTRGTDIEGTAKGILAALKSGGHKHGDSTLTAVSTPTSRRRSTARLRSSSSEWLTHLADNSNLPRLTELRDESEEITDLNVNSK